MAEITPRWEWRAFGQQFGAAEAAFAAFEPTGVQESDEVYVVAPAGDTVKIRAGLMDIKALREVGMAGLELWEPVMKAGFPLGATGVAAVLHALRLDDVPLGQEPYGLDEFLHLARAIGEVRVIDVHKKRIRYAVDGCAAEVTDVVADGRETRTIAIESEDAAAVIAAVDSVGLGDYLNTSYPRGLLALLDERPPRFAVIDVGTNSVKLHIGERDAAGRWHTVADQSDVSRLGEGVTAGGVIGGPPMERTISAIAGMVDLARHHGAVAVAAVGTAALRAAENRDDVISEVRERTGVTIGVISAEEETRLAYLAARSGIAEADGSIVVFDTGGGSTQFTFGHGLQVDERFSVPVGAVNVTERFGLDRVVSSAILDEARAAIAAELARLDAGAAPDELVAMGGTVTNLSAVKHGMATYDPDVVQGTVLDRAEIDRQVELFASRDAEARRSIVGLQPPRAEVILAGACIVAVVMDKLGRDTLTVSDRGLRHRLIVERFG